MTLTYKQRLLEHLGQYARSELQLKQPGIFRFRDTDYELDYIIPEGESEWLGIPSDMREMVRMYAEAHRIKRHRYFRHLNSSLAFALSLFVPFFEHSPASRETLLQALGISGTLQQWQAEYIPDEKERSNVDAWWAMPDGRQYFCEVKLTESEFGTAKPDAARLTKFEEIYRPILIPHVRPSRLEPKAFFQGYQVLRNCWCAAARDDAHVIFLYPEQHSVLTKLLEPILDDVVGPLRERIHVISTESVITGILAHHGCPAELRGYAEHLGRKFLLIK